MSNKANRFNKNPVAIKERLTVIEHILDMKEAVAKVLSKGSKALRKKTVFKRYPFNDGNTRTDIEL